MAYMKRMLWLLLALAEIVVAFVVAGPWVIVVLKIAITALFRKKLRDRRGVPQYCLKRPVLLIII